MRAIHETIEIVSISLAAVEKTDPKNYVEVVGSRGMMLQFRGAEKPTEVKKQGYVNWLLAKGFQEYARGTRACLERAHVYISVFKEFETGKKSTLGDMREFVAATQEWAEGAPFPRLLASVNSGLTTPLNFEAAFLSLQNVRNCLEHDNGRVTARRAQDGMLKLVFPRMKLFYEKDGQEIEVEIGSTVGGDDDGKGVMLKMRAVLEAREWKVGEQVTFKTAEFNDIGWGCWAFASELGAKLPQTKPPSTPTRLLACSLDRRSNAAAESVAGNRASSWRAPASAGAWRGGRRASLDKRNARVPGLTCGALPHERIPQRPISARARGGQGRAGRRETPSARDSRLAAAHSGKDPCSGVVEIGG